MAKRTWTIDPTHTQIEFSVKHMMFTTVRGRFARFDGVVSLDERASKDSGVEITIDAESLDTGVEARDNHLRSADFFDAEKFPVIDFVSTRIEADGDGYAIRGDLTIRGVTRPIMLEAEYAGTVPNMKGGRSAGFSARTKINREDFGLTWNVALESGGVMVSKDVKIEIDLEVVSAEQTAEAHAEVA
jgi:polyisoprenoid-binding protein YceI